MKGDIVPIYTIVLGNAIMHQFEALKHCRFCLSIRERHIFPHFVPFDAKTEVFSAIRTNVGLLIYQAKWTGSNATFVGDLSEIGLWNTSMRRPFFLVFDDFGSLRFPWSAPIVCILLSHICSVFKLLPSNHSRLGIACCIQKLCSIVTSLPFSRMLRGLTFRDRDECSY